ncbi:MAG: sensor histidine kinase [Candidatus Heimdallarchaeaceae archaeon]
METYSRSEKKVKSVKLSISIFVVMGSFFPFFIKDAQMRSVIHTGVCGILGIAFLIITITAFHKLSDELQVMALALILTVSILFMAQITYIILLFTKPSIAHFVMDCIIIVSYFPIIGLAIRRIIKDFIHFNKKMLPITFIFIILFCVAFFSLFAIVARYDITDIKLEVYISCVIILILDLLLVSLMMIIFAFYIQLEYSEYWLVAIAASLFLFLSDIFSTYRQLEIFNMLGGVEETFYCLLYASLIIGMMWLKDRPRKALSIDEIEKDRLKYQTLYSELDSIVKHLVTMNQFFRHDLQNDLVVITNAIGLYRDTNDEKFLVMAEKRVASIEKRLLSLASTNDILDGLALQPIPIHFINDIARLFDNVSLKIPNNEIYIKGNQLIYSIFYNIIENAFVHGGKGVKVRVVAEDMGEKVRIKVIDNGKGISEEAKHKILKGIMSPDRKNKIGMILAKRTIERLGGSFAIETNKPKGTIFVVELPKFTGEYHEG